MNCRGLAPSYSPCILLGLTLAAALALVSGQNAHCAEVDLNVPDYDQRVQELKPGDWVSFGDGRRFKLGDYLGSGNMAYVFALADRPDRVIRFAKRVETRPILKNSQQGLSTLARLNVPTVKTYPGESWVERYLIVERLHTKMTLQDLKLWIELPKAIARLENHGLPQHRERDQEYIQAYREQLSRNPVHAVKPEEVELALTAWEFDQIADYKMRDFMLWDGNGWKVVDTLSAHWALGIG